MVLNYESYVYQRWHGTLLVIAVVTFAVLFNTFAAKQLPTMEVLMLIFHVCGFVAVLIAMLVLSEKSSSQAVWTEFFDSGWGSYGTSTLVGIIANVIPLLGADAAAHMSGMSRIEVIVRGQMLTSYKQRSSKMPRTACHEP